MEAIASLIDPLLKSAEAYGNTSIELVKLRSLDKTATVMSSLTSRFFLAMVLFLFALILNIAVGFWLGELLGKTYYGFLVVASFDGFIALILFFIHPLIRARINNSLIKQMFN